jgi:hypothetical protein
MIQERLRSFFSANAFRRANSSESSSVATMCRVSSVLVVVLTMRGVDTISPPPSTTMFTFFTHGNGTRIQKHGEA